MESFCFMERQPSSFLTSMCLCPSLFFTHPQTLWTSETASSGSRAAAGGAGRSGGAGNGSDFCRGGIGRFQDRGRVWVRCWKTCV